MTPHRCSLRRSIPLTLLGLVLLACGPSPGGAPAIGRASQVAPAIPEPPPADLVHRPPPVEVVWQSDGGGFRLGGPTGLTVDRQGTLIVADAGHDRLVQVAGPTGQGLATWGSRGTAAGQFRFAPPPDSYQLDSGPPAGNTLAADADGRLYIADHLNDRIQVFDRQGQFQVAWGTHGAAAGQFDTPSGLAVSAHGALYVADRGNHRIQVFDRQGIPVLAWGGVGDEPGRFNRPNAVAVDRWGRVHVLDGGNQRVQVFDGAGRFRTAWGGFGRGPGEFIFPTALAVDPDGRVYVADSGNQRVQVFTDTGLFLGQWGGPGVEAGQFATVTGIAIDAAGAIYVADSALGRVQKFRPQRPWPMVAGTPTPRPTRPMPTPALARPGVVEPTRPISFMTPADR